MKNTYRIGFGLLVSLFVAACSLGLSVPALTPTPEAIPGWEKFSGEGVELWLPESFAGGDIQTALPEAIEELRSLGAEYRLMADNISQNADLFIFWVFDTHTETPGFVTNVNITREQAPEGFTLDQLLASMEQQLAANFSLLGSEKSQLSNYEAGRFDLQLDLPYASVREVIYVFLEGGNVYALTFGTGVDEFEARLSDFEQSANTLRILR